ncbi:MAG: transposase [archaeon]|jgi:IS605 OrfB family transposase
MKTQRTIALVIKDSKNLVGVVMEYNRYQKAISETAFNGGEPLSAFDLQKAVYHTVETTLLSQMKCSAIRGVASAYSSARSNGRPATRPFIFKRPAALFLFNKNFSFTGKGKLSITTSQGREKLDFIVPDYAKADFDQAVSYDSITVTGSGAVRLCLTLEVPDPKSITPVGIDLGANNPLVASVEGGEVLFVSGSALAQANRRTRKTRQRLQSKLAVQKAQGKSARSVRRSLKRLGRKQSDRSRTFCKQTAAELCSWAPKDSVLVFEDLKFDQVSKGDRKRKGTHRKLSQWFYGQMIQACSSKAERLGLGVAFVNPAYTSQKCRKCGLIGTRSGHSFSCVCGHSEHADVNASHNIRRNYAVLRDGGHQSACPEARPRKRRGQATAL